MRDWFPAITSCRSWDKPDGDAQVMRGLEPESFDFVHSSHCLEHLVDARAALCRWWNLVKPGGCLVVAVPDEDLYEQGVYPSTWNREHKWTFSILKRDSWSPVHLDLLPMLLDLPGGELLRISLQDAGYPYDETERRDRSLDFWVEMQIEAAVRKHPHASSSQSATHGGNPVAVRMTAPTLKRGEDAAGAAQGGRGHLDRDVAVRMTAPTLKRGEDAAGAAQGGRGHLDRDVAVRMTAPTLIDAGLLADIERAGVRLHRPDPERHERRWQEALATLQPDPAPILPDASGRIGLGLHGAAHLGDTLCTSSLPERLTREVGCRVEVIHYRTTLNVFANNPHVSGFSTRDCPNIEHKRIQARGHVIQRLEWAFGLQPQVWPRGRLHFSAAELEEADNWRQWVLAHHQEEKLAIVACSSITHRDKFTWAPWETLAKLLRDHGYAVLHAPVTLARTLNHVARDVTAPTDEPMLHPMHAVRWENMDLREWMATLSVADLYLGVESGGAHVAAAVGIPAIVAMPSGYDYRAFDPSFNGPPRLFHWLYPQHHYLLPT